MIGVVIPAHNEARHIAACLRSVREAARCPSLQGEAVRVVVALDYCTDDTHAIASRLGAECIFVCACNVGVARAHGAQRALDAGARWLAFTDADSTVAPDWLHAQLAQGSEVVCGTVAVADWSDWPPQLRRQHEAAYTDADGHRHVHGANLGVCAAAYRRVGGFAPLPTSEDVALVDALREGGASIAWSAAPRVVTSARKNFRAPGGFGAALRRVHAEVTGVARVAVAPC